MRARYLLSTYGAYEAYQLVLFNLDAFRMGNDGISEQFDEERIRRGSRLSMGIGYFNGAGFGGGAVFPAFSLSGIEELQPLLYVMAAALLFERLKLRQTLLRYPFQAIGLLSLAGELPVTRNRR